MSNILDYLKFDNKRFGTSAMGTYGLNYGEQEIVFKTGIKKIDKNPYYLDNKSEKVCHYEFQIMSIIKDLVENTESIEGTLPFKMTSYSKIPNIDQFSEHIKSECVATLKALEATDKYVWDIPFPNWRDITPEQVYVYIKEIHKSYENTGEFLKVYDFYLTRLYNNWKWIDSIIRGGHGILSDETFPIGEHLLAFLEIGKYADYYKLV